NDGKVEQAQLWNNYQSVGTKSVFGPSAQKKDSPNFQFQLRYLDIIEKGREIHNETLLPFWNKAGPDAWDKFQAKLGATPTKPTAGVSASTKNPVSAVLDAVTAYQNDYDTAIEPVKVRYEQYDQEMRAISAQLRSDPGLAKTAVRLGY